MIFLYSLSLSLSLLFVCLFFYLMITVRGLDTTKKLSPERCIILFNELTTSVWSDRRLVCLRQQNRSPLLADNGDHALCVCVWRGCVEAIFEIFWIRWMDKLDRMTKATPRLPKKRTISCWYDRYHSCALSRPHISDRMSAGPSSQAISYFGYKTDRDNAWIS